MKNKSTNNNKTRKSEISHCNIEKRAFEFHKFLHPNYTITLYSIQIFKKVSGSW